MSKLLKAAVAMYLGAIFLLFLFETNLVYPRPGVERGNWAPTKFEFEDVSFVSPDGTSLHGWFLEETNAKKVMLFCHGNAEHVADLGPEMNMLRERFGVSVFVFDYRGYGKSQGKPSEKLVLADSQAAHDWLVKRTGVQADQVILYGRSLGGGPAVYLAQKNGASALLLDRTFHSMVGIAAEMYRWAPVSFVMRNRYESFKLIGEYRGPLLQVHGLPDEVVPYWSGKKLFEAVTSDDKQFIEIPDLYHNDRTPEEFYSAINVLFGRLK